MIKNILPAILWSVFVLFVSLVPGNELPKFQMEFLFVDKIAHAALFAGLSFFWVFGLKKAGYKTLLNLRMDLVLFGGILLFGIGIELLQHFVIPQRHFDFFDIIANGVGIIIGFLFFNYVICKKN